MKLKTIAQTSMIWVLSVSIAIPQSAMAQSSGRSVFSIFEDDDTADTGIIPSNPTLPNNGNNNGNGNNTGNNNGNNNNGNGNNNNNNNGGSFFPGNGPRPGQNNNNNNNNNGFNNGFNNNNNNNNGKSTTMSKAQVTAAYQCPLFTSTAHADLIKSIDELTKQVNTTPECQQDTNVKTIESNNDTLKKNIDALQRMMTASAVGGDPTTTVTADAVTSEMTKAMTALGGIGDILNNQSFLNSNCGRQTMSAGKALLSFNDMVNGLTPYALFAVAMNPAFSAAVPFVVGATIATTGISIIGKMMDDKAIDLNNSAQREAVLVNICQYTKVAKKVRFMQLAQSGKIDKITNELNSEIDLYSAQIASREQKISTLLTYRTKKYSDIGITEKQLEADKQDISGVEEQIDKNRDDFTTCTFARELVNWAADGKSFPASVYVNLDRAAQQSDRTTKLKVLAERTLHENSMRKLVTLGNQTLVDDAVLKSCSEVGRSWMGSIRRSVNLTGNITYQQKVALESELSQNTEYREWVAKYNLFQQQKTTIQRVSKVMEQLSQDDSIINRSELAQKMTVLKAGLFGRSKSIQFIGGKPPVLQWIEHTKSKHDMSVAAFIKGMGALREGAWSLTDTGRNKNSRALPKGGYYYPPGQMDRDQQIQKDLSNFNLTSLPLGSREHDRACQLLENAWVDWAASLDHLGAIQFFCEMIDPVLDINMDPRVLQGCRGNLKLSGIEVYPSLVSSAKDTLIRGGYRKDASLVSKRLKELQCPVPSVTVMNE